MLEGSWQGPNFVYIIPTFVWYDQGKLWKTSVRIGDYSDRVMPTVYELRYGRSFKRHCVSIMLLSPVSISQFPT